MGTTTHGLRDYAVVTGAYWVFTLTDGAIRTLVLLHLNELGYTPLEIAGMFAAYEVLGVLTNLVGGWLGARFGLKLPLGLGLLLQAATLGVLGVAADGLTLALLVGGQSACGVAKDLVKTSAKSYVKLVVPAGERGRLLRLVSVLTGSKNALKGLGFLLGGVLLASVGFGAACSGMAVALVLACGASMALLPSAPGKAQGVRPSSLFSDDARLNWLAAARLFLFASRDAWFVLAVPVFLRSDLAWSYAAVSGFLAAWTVGYGLVQAAAPRAIGAHPRGAQVAPFALASLVPLVAIAALLAAGVPPGATLVVGLVAFGVVFALNSALHSYLVVEYAAHDRPAASVGFYYASNATGRLLGTLLSGAVFAAAGLGADGVVACLVAAAVLTALSAALAVPLAAAERRHAVR